jgi:hypothetical protein
VPQPFYRNDFRSVSHYGQGQAAIDPPSIHQNGARATLAVIAALFGSCEVSLSRKCYPWLDGKRSCLPRCEYHECRRGFEHGIHSASQSWFFTRGGDVVSAGNAKSSAPREGFLCTLSDRISTHKVCMRAVKRKWLGAPRGGQPCRKAHQRP